MDEECAVVLRPSSLSGVGVFTTAPIAAGAEVNLFAGKDWLFVDDDVEKLSPQLQHYVVLSDGGYYRPKNFRAMSIGWYLNHADPPNLRGDDQDRWFAIRDIAADEELTVDYRSLSEDGANALEEVVLWP